MISAGGDVEFDSRTRWKIRKEGDCQGCRAIVISSSQVKIMVGRLTAELVLRLGYRLGERCRRDHRPLIWVTVLFEWSFTRCDLFSRLPAPVAVQDADAVTPVGRIAVEYFFAGACLPTRHPSGFLIDRYSFVCLDLGPLRIGTNKFSAKRVEHLGSRGDMVSHLRCLQ
jgi:hypothetical protein